MNAIITPPDTLHGCIPFTDISVQDMREAIMQGMDEENKEIERLLACADKPTFKNTIEPLAMSGELLGRATAIMYNLASAETNDELDALTNEVAPMLTEHSNRMMLNEALFDRVRYVKEHAPATLTDEQRMLLKNTYDGFLRSGAALDAAGKERYRDISMQLSTLGLQFSQNLLKETNAYVLHITDEAELAGLPDMHRKAAAEEAKERGLGGWVFTLKAPSFGPFMMYAENRKRRRELYMAYHTRATHANDANNFDVVRNIVNLRREKAQLLGFTDYADYALRHRMAADKEHVMQLLDTLIVHYKEPAEREVQEVRERALAEEGDDFEFMPWDFSFYSQKIKKERYDYDPDMLRPYLELSQVQRGVFGLATRLYGITFKQNKDIPVYHPDVVAYEVFDADGKFLALFYADFFPREGKRGGAWMTSFQDEACLAPDNEQPTPDNTRRPHVAIVMNFTKPTADTPSLLTLGELQTFMHEFGHALHAIFAMTRYEALSGTSVYWDFVELPSQFMENYAVEPEFLRGFAYHYQTGECIPQAYIDRIQKSRRFQAAYACMRQVSFGLLDMAYYTLQEPFTQDVKTFECEAWQRAQLLPHVDGTCMTVQFGHIMSGGYAAGYYSYKWAELLDADAFAYFKRHGIFNTEVAASFRQHVLSRGGTEPPMQLYLRFRGQEPTIEALLERDGIK